jgi:hypothetical protein
MTTSCAGAASAIARIRLVTRYLELTAHNRLVGGSSPPGPTTHRSESFDLNALAPKLSSLIPVLDNDLFTIRPRPVSPWLRVPCACGPRPWCSAAPQKARRGQGLPRSGSRYIRSQRDGDPVPRLGASGPEHRHAIALVPRGTQACQVVDRRPKSEERVDEDASDGFFVGQADGGGCVGRCAAHGAATDQIT